VQSKGLEFDDVFIVNFFSESPCKEEWRVLLQVRLFLLNHHTMRGSGAWRRRQRWGGV
jgi:hypothetical protein